MKTLTMQLSSAYTIYLDCNLLEQPLLAECCKQLNKRIVIITDSNLVDTLGKKLQQQLLKYDIQAVLLSFSAGEQYKTRETKQSLEDALLEQAYGRDTCLIALGGGVVSDLVGFLAATYCRGVPVIYIPTTLLAMVDASIGGKTSVNTPQGKNLIGTFTQPHAVFMDPNVLGTLPTKEWQNGLAEIIKHSMIADANLFSLVTMLPEKIQDIHFILDMIYANCVIKKNIVEQDEREQGIRQLLNFGHTIGHAIEKIENYNISHGEAVAIGMLVECYVANLCGYLHKNTTITLQTCLRNCGLSLQTLAFQDKERFKQTLILDKKSINTIPHFVLLDAIGKPHQEGDRYTMPVDAVYLNQALEWASCELP